MKTKWKWLVYCLFWFTCIFKWLHFFIPKHYILVKDDLAHKNIVMWLSQTQLTYNSAPLSIIFWKSTLAKDSQENCYILNHWPDPGTSFLQKHCIQPCEMNYNGEKHICLFWWLLRLTQKTSYTRRPTNNKVDTFRLGSRTRAMNATHKPIPSAGNMEIKNTCKDWNTCT